MSSEKGWCCEHDKIYDPNKACLYIAILSNCKECYLSLYSQLCEEKNIKIYGMKVIRENGWKRGRDGRLFRKKEYLDPNFHCPTLGLECECPWQKDAPRKTKHFLKSSNAIPKVYSIDRNKSLSLSLTCAPKYHGQSERNYRKIILRRDMILQQSNKKYKKFIRNKNICAINDDI